METSSEPDNISQFSANNRLWDWKAALLALAIVGISSRRLVITEWAPHLYFVQIMGLIGTVLGLALGYSNFSRQSVTRLAAGYTMILIPAQLLSAVEKTGWLWHDILALLERLVFSLDQFIRNKPVYDPLFFVSVVTPIYWLIGLAAGYWLIRHRNFLNVILPSGLAILTVQAFDSVQTSHIWNLAFFFSASLLLLGRMYLLKNRSFWKKSHFLLTDEAMSDLERGTLVITAIAVFVAWSLPGWISGVEPALKAWTDFSQPIYDRFSNAVSALESPYAERNTRGDFYSKALSIGQQAALGDTPVFTVQITNRGNGFIPVRSYWKGRNYDVYFNGRWVTAEDSSEPFIPTVNELAVEYPQGRNGMNFTFTSSAKQQRLLYAPAETIWASRASEVQSTPISGEIRDVTAWVSTTILSSGNQYKVRALIADPTIGELRSAGTEYPAWVTERYLQVPGEIAPQFSELALEITAPYDTAYDKVQAITAYLRKEIEYDTKIEGTPPENRDPVLWVLFEYKKGFCMYYASAETLMLRSIGIPARMAVGFVEGAYDEVERKYTVAYKDSHAWPEVYFPGIGWVEFEPTSNQFPIERPETKNSPDSALSGTDTGGDQAAVPSPSTLPERPGSQPDEESGILLAEQTTWYQNILVPFLILLTTVFGVFITRRYSLNDRLPVYLAYQYERRGNVPPNCLKRWVRWTTLSPIERAFQTVNLSLDWLGHSQPAHVTSKERAEVLIKNLPEAEGQTLSLLEEYHKVLYTTRKGNPTAARKAAAAILLKTWQSRIKRTLQSAESRYNQLK